MSRYQLGADDCIRGASGRNYAIRCRTDHAGVAEWFVGLPSISGWGTPFVSEPLARAWARAH